MTPIPKQLLSRARRRSIPSTGFSWIDRRFLRDGFLRELSAPEALLYFFLCAAADKDGLSLWGDRRIAMLLTLSDKAVDRARAGLIDKELLLYRAPIWQLLALPDRPIGQGLTAVTLPTKGPPPGNGPQTIADVLRRIL